MDLLRVCLVEVKTGRMENKERKIWWKMLFSTVWLEKENGEDKKPERKFSLPSPLFLSSQIGRKIWREKCCESTFTQIPSPTYPHSWPDDPLTYPTWWLLPINHPYHFCLFLSYLHSTPTFSGLGSFFFFFQRDWSIKFICTLL